MASATKKTELKRKRRDARMGKTRKAENRNEGTTRSAAELFGDK
ncbi:MAG: hypothetical protein AAF202_04380 [Pseudomonadota bacterium]